MNEQVLISIKGMQIGRDTGAESISSEHEGRYFVKDDKRYLMYSEKVEGSDEITKCLIKIGIKEVIVTKRGVVNVEMPFCLGVKKLTNYDTQFGGFTLGFKTKNITCVETSGSLDLDIDYVLDMNYDYLADCHISIRVKNKESL
ncbi:MAG: DUF1934 domain-containing protein [Lachnospiraceae bacterium]|nr:DUF1934 domain-containing protein [Lachnospiraceae bacterium]